MTQRPFRAVMARRGTDVVSPNGSVWATCQRPDHARVIAALLSSPTSEALALLVAQAEKPPAEDIADA